MTGYYVTVDKFNLFYQNLTMSGFFPKITLPTRLSETACTLIDNVITNNIIHNDETLTDNEEIADCFNSYFANIGVQLSSSFEESDRMPSFETYLGDDNVNPNLSFHFTPVTEDLVLTLISNLQNKTSSGMDGISNKLLKWIKYIVVQPLKTHH